MQIPMQTAPAIPAPGQKNELQIPQQSAARVELADSPCAIDARCGAIARRDRLSAFASSALRHRQGIQPRVRNAGISDTVGAGRNRVRPRRRRAQGAQISRRTGPRARQSDSGRTQSRHARDSPGNQNSVLKLPSVFHGCWELVNDQQNGPVHLQPGAPEGCIYTHDSGRFCYQRGADGNYVPSFSSLRLTPGLYGTQTEQWSRLELVSTDGVASMRMRFLLHHEEAGGSFFGFVFRAPPRSTRLTNSPVASRATQCIAKIASSAASAGSRGVTRRISMNSSGSQT